MATQVVKDGLAAGFTLDEMRASAAEKYREGISAGFSRAEMDQAIADEYGFKFNYNTNAPDDADQFAEWMEVDPSKASEASINEEVEDLAQTFKAPKNEAQDSAQRAEVIKEEWNKLDADPFMRRGTRNYTDTELSSSALYKQRDEGLYQSNDFSTDQSDEAITAMRDPSYSGVRPLTPADRMQQDKLLSEGRFQIEPDKPLLPAVPGKDSIQAASSETSLALGNTPNTRWNPVREASGLMEHAMSGYQSSVTGMFTRESMPNLVPGPDSDFSDKVAHTLGNMVGDLPSFIPGAVAGGALTSETVVGTVPGAVAGGMALTEAAKKTLMLRYTEGEVKDFNDFMYRTGQVTWAGTKGAATGFIGGYVGGYAGSKMFSGLTSMGLSDASSAFIATNVARPTAEVGAFTTVGAALNGHVPTSEDFLVGLGTVGLSKVGGFYTSKLKDTYVQTDMSPKGLVQFMNRDVSAKEDVLSTNMNVPRSLGGDYRPAYMLSREALPENLVDYKGAPQWMRLSRNEAEQVARGTNKKNGFGDDGAYKGQLPEGTKAPTPTQAVPYTIKADAPLLWLKTPSDPNIGRLFRQFAEQTDPKLLEGIPAGSQAGLQKLGIKMFKQPTPQFLDWLQKGEGRVGVKEEQVLGSDLQGMRMGEQVMMFNNANVMPAALLETPGKSLAYSADAIASSLSVGELPSRTFGDRLMEAYQQTNDKFQPLNKPAPVGMMTPSYLMARLYPGTDGIFLHWMEHGSTMFGKVSSSKAAMPERSVSGQSYKAVLTEGVKGGHELRKAFAGDQEALGVFKDAFREQDRITIAETKKELATRLSEGDISKKAYDAAIKRIEKDFSGEAEVSKYGENDPLFHFRTYITAKHISNLADRGIIAGPDLAAARSIANDPTFQKHMEPAAQAYYAYNKRLQQYRYDAGLISKKQLKDMELQSPYYVPLNRVIEGQGEYVSTGSFALKGSNRKIIDPLESTIRQTQHVLKQAEKNQVMRLIAEQFGKELRTSKDPNSGAAKSTLAKMDSATAKAQGASSGSTIKYMEGGTEKTAQVPLDIKKTAGMLDPVSSNVLINLTGALTSVNRAGIILHPAFALRNLTRDQMSAAINSTQDVKPWFGFLRGLSDMVISDKNKVSQKLFPNTERYYQEWLRHGGAISNLVSQNRKYSQEMISGLLKANNTVNSIPLAERAVSSLTQYLNPLNVAAKGYKGLQRIAEVSEEGTRMGEYIANRKAGVSPLESAMRSREITIDFARSGAVIKSLNAISLFLNAKVQGADRSVRQVIQDPGGTARRTMAYIAVPTIMMAMARNDYMYNSADGDVAKQLKQIPDWQKQAYWIVPSDRGIFRIPKPQELGIPFANPIESFVDHMYAKTYEEGYDTNFLEKLYSEGYFGTVMDQFFLTPASWQSAVTPSALGHIAAVGYNMDPFTRTPIIPPAQEKLLPEARYSRDTTELSKRITYLLKNIDPLFDSNVGQRFQSPQSIDYLVQAYGGTIGKELWSLLDTAAQEAGIIDKVNKPAGSLAENWFIRSFMVKYPSAGAKSITDYYEKANRMEQTLNTIKAHMKQGTETGIERAQQLMIEGSYGRLTTYTTLLGSLNRSIQQITMSDRFTPEEKRMKIEGMYIQMIETADQGLKIMNSMDKAAIERRKLAEEAQGVN